MSIFWEDFLCGEYSFLDGCLAIRNGRVGRVGCLECWVSDKKSLDFYILEDYPSNHAWYLHSGNHQKKNNGPKCIKISLMDRMLFESP